METKCIPKVLEYILVAAHAVIANKQTTRIKGTNVFQVKKKRH